MNEARIERYCPDPDCDWKLVEPLTEMGKPIDASVTVPWAGSVRASIDSEVARRVDSHYALIEAACDAHIREAHDADDPIGWATRTVERQKLVELFQAAEAEEAARYQAGPAAKPGVAEMGEVRGRLGSKGERK